MRCLTNVCHPLNTLELLQEVLLCCGKAMGRNAFADHPKAKYSYYKSNTQAITAVIASSVRSTAIIGFTDPILLHDGNEYPLL